MEEKVLKSVFGFEKFRPGQKEIIDSVRDNRQTLGILPTSRGKSLCYQLPSYLLPGATLVVSPLISLMEDQMLQLRKLGEKRLVAINSQLNHHDKQWVLQKIDTYKFIFISPESLSQPAVLAALKSIHLSLFVVDEAHCVSQWGLDFRPEYERLSFVIEQLKPAHVLALTATADEQTTADILAKLFLSKSDVAVFRHSVDRENIGYQVVRTNGKLAYLIDFIRQHPGPGIIYFSSREQCEKLSFMLNENTESPVGYYHGGMSAEDRQLIQQQFLNDDLALLCATSAFGMGIDKPNVRFVIHYHLPSSLEAYVQESGRGGRDGQPTLSLILYQAGDEFIYNFHKKELEEGLAFVDSLTTFQQSPAYPELYNKWVIDLNDQIYTKDYLKAALEGKLVLKNQGLQLISDYINLKTCRRSFILEHFNETEKNPSNWCCDNCGMYDKLIPMSEFLYKKSLNPVISWKEKLKNLFNLV